MLPDSLFDVLRAYATLRPPKSIKRPDVHFSLVHEFFLDGLLLNRHFQEYPPSRQYQLSFWKWAIDWLESLASDPDEDEVDERIYTHHVELMQASSFKGVGLARPTTSYLTYLWSSKVVVEGAVCPGYGHATLMESRTTVESGTTGLRTWSASLILAQHILSHPELVQGKRVLELGCGVGFLGVIAALVQLHTECTDTSSLLLTDVNEPVLERCELNLSLPCNPSHRHPDTKVQLLDWSDAVDPDRLPALCTFFQKARPDLILGADLVYEPTIIPLLVKVLVIALVSGDGTHTPMANIALTVRNESTVSEFLRQAGEVLSIEEVNTTLVSENIFTGTGELGQDGSQAVKIFQLRRKP